MSAKHTPAPWTLESDGWCDEAEIWENQRLISAAPELLAALINMRWAAGELDAKNRIRSFDQFMDEAAAVIAKAIGAAA